MISVLLDKHAEACPDNEFCRRLELDDMQLENPADAKSDNEVDELEGNGKILSLATVLPILTLT